jgi:hypothetical protein
VKKVNTLKPVFGGRNGMFSQDYTTSHATTRKNSRFSEYLNLKLYKVKKTLLLLIFAALVSGVIAQAPQKFNYQAVARNSGDVLAEQAITVRISILQNENMVWQEEHPVVTSPLGHFVMQVGGPAAINGNGKCRLLCRD